MMDATEEPDNDAAGRARLVYPCGEAPKAGRVKPVAPGVFWVRMPLPFALQWINLWLIEDGDGYTLVDTGLATQEARANWELIFADKLRGKSIKRVICTHMHPDHVGLAGWISERFRCRLWMTRLEYVTCRMLVADTGRPAPEEGVRFYRSAGWNDAELANYRAKFGGFGRGVSALPEEFRRIDDGATIRIGARDWRVVAGHGHSPEHACLWQPELKLLISGDQVLPRISSNVSVFPTEPDADPLTDWLESCEKLRTLIPADTLVLPAHNEPFLGLHGRLRDLIGGHERTLARIEQRLAEGDKRAVDLFTTLFGRKVDADLLFLATGESIAHLNYLIERGRARAVHGTDGATRYTLSA
jgi:glyoxylase-like metal-dependent hydrolase (beta-lactamase superfamily II)